MTQGDEQRLGDQFRAKRKAMKKTQRQAAEATGVSLRTLQSFETGTATPQPANLRSLLNWAGLGQGVPLGAEIVERAWPSDVSVFLDVLGAYLVSIDEAERLRTIHSLTRQIFVTRNESE